MSTINYASILPPPPPSVALGVISMQAAIKKMTSLRARQFREKTYFY